MYSGLLGEEITVSYSIQGECLGFYVINRYIGIQSEDDGTWFNSMGPFLLSRSGELISAIETLIMNSNGEEAEVSPPLETHITGTSFYLGVLDEYIPQIKDESESFIDEDGDKILLEFNPSMQAHVHWIKDLKALLPCFQVLIQTIAE